MAGEIVSAAPCDDGCANCQRLEQEAAQLRAALTLADLQLKRVRAGMVMASIRPPPVEQPE